MSVQLIANSGILMDDRLDKLRQDALIACNATLPEAVVYYIRALENEHIEQKFYRHKQSLREVGWKHEDQTS